MNIRNIQSVAWLPLTAITFCFGIAEVGAKEKCKVKEEFETTQSYGIVAFELKNGETDKLNPENYKITRMLSVRPKVSNLKGVLLDSTGGTPPLIIRKIKDNEQQYYWGEWHFNFPPMRQTGGFIETVAVIAADLTAKKLVGIDGEFKSNLYSEHAEFLEDDPELYAAFVGYPANSKVHAKSSENSFHKWLLDSDKQSSISLAATLPSDTAQGQVYSFSATDIKTAIANQDDIERAAREKISIRGCEVEANPF